MKSYDSEFLRLVLESNEKRKEEIRDEELIREAEMVLEKANEAAEKVIGEG